MPCPCCRGHRHHSRSEARPGGSPCSASSVPGTSSSRDGPCARHRALLRRGRHQLVIVATAPGRLRPSNLVHENRGELLPRVPLLALRFGRRRPPPPSSSNPCIRVHACACCRLLLLLLSLMLVLPVVAAVVPCSTATAACACLRCCRVCRCLPLPLPIAAFAAAYCCCLLRNCYATRLLLLPPGC